MTALLNEPASSRGAAATPPLDSRGAAASAPDVRCDTAGADLGGMTKTELLDYAEQTGVEGVSSAMKKAEIIEAIKGA